MPPVFPAADAALTTKITVTTAGTPVQGGDIASANGFLMTPLPTNSGYSYWMYHGQTKANKGFPVGVGQVIYIPVTNLNQVDFDADANSSIIMVQKL